MTILTRKQKEKLVIDLYFNQNKTYRYISKVAHICPRDIKTIVQKASDDYESEQTPSKAAQAYRMFQEGKSPMDVAITLDLSEPEVTKLYKESWNLKQIYDLNQIYLETKGDLASFVKLYKLSKSAGYSAGQVDWLLKVANKGLPELERRYYSIQSDADSLEAKKQNLASIIQDYSGQVTGLGKTFDDYCRSCQQEEKRLTDLRTKRMQQEVLVSQFENNDPKYLKIRKAAEEKVRGTLSKDLLKIALLSLTESIRSDPSRFSFLFCDNTPSTMYYAHMGGLEQYQSSEDYMAVLIDEANKLYETLVRELQDEIIRDDDVSTSSPASPSLSYLSPSEQRFSLHGTHKSV